ncbi:MAG: hypothetical protein V2I35_00925 [Desulfocapsaceae bacterium]|jgi:hypothetical protein|nr:hypothetical protein [Desulfocapsaceae bacterium]
MTPDTSKICFGLSLELDRASCASYLQLLGRKEFSERFADRLSSEEIETVIDMIGSLLHKHLNKQEYHRLFLLDENHHD